MERVTYSLAAAGFLGIALLQFIAAMVTTSDALSNALGGSVCLIAGLHYRWMRAAREDYIENCEDASVTTTTRYSDWYMTTVLMLIEFFNLAGTLQSRWEWLLASCVACELMILCGHVATVLAHARLPYSRVAFAAGVGCGTLLTACFVVGTLETTEEDHSNSNHNSNHNNQWMYAFASLWVLYPFAYWTGTYRELVYNLLDIYSKGLFGIVLAIVALLRQQQVFI